MVKAIGVVNSFRRNCVKRNIINMNEHGSSCGHPRIGYGSAWAITWHEPDQGTLDFGRRSLRCRWFCCCHCWYYAAVRVAGVVAAVVVTAAALVVHAKDQHAAGFGDWHLLRRSIFGSRTSHLLS